MSWIWTTYLIASYVGLALLLYVGQGNGEAWERLKRVIATWSLWRKAMVAIAWTLVFLLLGPLLPLFLIYCFLRERQKTRFWEGFGRQHRDAIMEPIAFNQMHPAGRFFVEALEEAALAAGFRKHNDYLYKPEPLLIEARYYLSGTGETILSVGHIDGEEYYSLTSFLGDGTGVETSVSHHPIDVNDINATGHYYVQMFGLEAGADVASIYDRHVTYLRQLNRSIGADVTVMRPDQLVPAVRYANRRFAETKELLGSLNDAPPRAEWPFEDHRIDAR